MLVLCLVLIYYTLLGCIGCIRHRMEHKALIICAWIPKESKYLFCHFAKKTFTIKSV